jgi:hypothetical protein
MASSGSSFFITSAEMFHYYKSVISFTRLSKTVRVRTERVIFDHGLQHLNMTGYLFPRPTFTSPSLHLLSDELIASSRLVICHRRQLSPTNWRKVDESFDTLLMVL